jgi:hypothetical protein
MATEKNAYYANVYTAVEGVPLLNGHEKYEVDADSNAAAVHSTAAATNAFVYPALRRASAAGPPGPPKDHVLIRTAGNALQAVPRSYYEQTIAKTNVLGVHVPPNSRGGDVLVVQNPNNPRRMLQIKVPNDHAPGQMFFVEMPIRDAPAAGVAAEEPSHELELSSAPVTTGPDVSPDFVLVQVPEGQTPGSRLQVTLADGRILVAVVPSDPTIREFYMKVPDTTNNADMIPATYLV